MAAETDDGGGNGTKIILAAIAVVGTVSAALFPNWDKVFGHTAQPVPASAPSPSPAPAPTPAPTPAPASVTTTTTSDTESEPKIKRTRPAPMQAQMPEQQTAESDGSDDQIRSLAGFWRDNLGRTVQIEQNGTQVRTQTYGAPSVAFQLTSRNFGFTYGPSPTDPGGACQGTIMPGDNLIQLRCQTIVGAIWFAQIVRMG